jgi:hypothetical protein
VQKEAGELKIQGRALDRSRAAASAPTLRFLAPLLLFAGTGFFYDFQYFEREYGYIYMRKYYHTYGKVVLYTVRWFNVYSGNTDPSGYSH